MSQENVEAFKRVIEALNRRDIESLLERYDPDVEERYALESLHGGEAVVHRGHEGVREAFQAGVINQRPVHERPWLERPSLARSEPLGHHWVRSTTPMLRPSDSISGST